MLTAQTSQPPAPPQRSPQQWNLPTTEVTIAASVLVALAYKSWVQPVLDKIQRGLQYSKEQDASIRDCLTSIRTLAIADRVMLCQFVEGAKTLAGKPTYSLLVSHEVTAANITKASPVASTGNSTCVDFVLQSLVANEFQKRQLPEINDLSYRQYLYSLGVYYVVCNLLKIDGEPVGFVVLHYTNRTSYIDWDAIAERDIEPDCQRISFVLKNHCKLLPTLLRIIRGG